MQTLENGEYASTDCYITHMEVSSNPLIVLLITDMLVYLQLSASHCLHACIQENTSCTEIKDTGDVRMEYQLGNSAQQSEGHTV